MKSDRIDYVIVGVFVSAMVAGLVVAVALLSGRTGDTESYYTSYRDVTGLKFGSQVLYMGFPVGQVESITPVVGDDGVEFELELAISDAFKSWKVPSDSVARIKASGLLSAVAIDIRAGSGPSTLAPGDFIRGEEGADIFGAVSDTANTLKRLAETRIEPLVASLARHVDVIGSVLATDGAAVVRDLRVVSSSLAARAPELVDRVVSLSESIKLTSDKFASVLSDDAAGKVGDVVDNFVTASASLALLSEEARRNFDALIGPRSHGRVHGMVDNLSAASISVASLARNLDSRLGEALTPETAVKIQRAIDDFALAARNVSTLTDDLRATRMELDTFISDLNDVTRENRPDLRSSVADLRRTLHSVAQNVDTITYNLEGATRNMNEFSRMLRDNPAVLLRGTTPSEDGAAGGGGG
ncbi:MAG: MlaD family protein [Gammaproteobacteria bacterium]|nr:MlaD family protein [Gammaproteobacteria bacterium]